MNNNQETFSPEDYLRRVLTSFAREAGYDPQEAQNNCNTALSLLREQIAVDTVLGMAEAFDQNRSTHPVYTAGEVAENLHKMSALITKYGYDNLLDKFDDEDDLDHDTS